MLEHGHNEVFTYDKDKNTQNFVNIQPNSFPYILVNIGSGVSILKVHSKDHFERISGSSIGGGTFWGLAKLLTKVESYENVQTLCDTGDNTNVDLLVGDIYGSVCNNHNRKPNSHNSHIIIIGLQKFWLRCKHLGKQVSSEAPIFIIDTNTILQFWKSRRQV